jgi:hypothetical protein
VRKSTGVGRLAPKEEFERKNVFESDSSVRLHLCVFNASDKVELRSLAKVGFAKPKGLAQKIFQSGKL